MVHLNLWVGFFSKCLAGSDLLLLSARSMHRIVASWTVSPIQFWENGRWIANACLSSSNHWNAIRLSLFLSKLSIMEPTNLLGNPVAIYLLTIRLISMPKLVVIFLALSNSTILAMCFYVTGVFDVQCTGSFFILWYTWVVILPLFWTISVSRIFFGLIYKVSFIFCWYEFNAL